MLNLWDTYDACLLLLELHFIGRCIIVLRVMKARDKILVCSLCNALGLFLPTGIPCLPSFICWLFMRNDADAEVADYARRRLNTSISWTIWFYASLFVCGLHVFLMLLGFMSIFVLGVWWVVACIKDLIRVSSGDSSYRFGLTIEFIRPRKSGGGEC